ncbi:unnamed protein product [Paramecium sonneborni]|uniref:Uncharacterized protein n=1 Tax=Paramecium sonneborni TaxID=65129 RepID=A0A8S1P5N3_9CILI|nr:unnamed protein product [Paramecium sonneborni]
MQDKLQESLQLGIPINSKMVPNQDLDIDCKLENQQNQIIFSSISNLEISNSLFPCKSIENSLYYKNSALINAFNVLQSNIQLMRNMYEQQENPFAVWLCDQGEWKIIIVNDKVPQKAVAKLLGANFDWLTYHKNQNSKLEDLKVILDLKYSILYVELFQNSMNNAYVIKSIHNQNQQDFIELQAINKKLFIMKEPFWKVLNSFQVGTLQRVVLFHKFIQIKILSTFCLIMKNPIERKLDFLEHTYIYTFKINENKSCWFSILLNNQLKSNMNQLILLKIYICKLKKGQYTLLCQAEFYDHESLSQELKNQQQILKLQIQAIEPPKVFNQTHQNEVKLKELIIQMIRQKSTIQNTQNCKDQGFPDVQKTRGQIEGFIYIYYENHDDTKFEEKLEFFDDQNLIKYETQKMDTFVKISLPPQDYLLILYKFNPKVLLPQNKISFKYKISPHDQKIPELSLFDYMKYIQVFSYCFLTLLLLQSKLSVNQNYRIQQFIKKIQL